MLIIFLRKRKKNYLDNGGINMKKSTVLSLATAGAIVATSLGTFAAWDTTNATNTGTLKLGSPVNISSAATTYNDAERTLGQDPSYSANVTFKVDDADHLVKELDVTKIAVYEKDDTTKQTPVTDKFTITVAGAAGNSDVTTSGATLTDTSVGETNDYTVTLTPTAAELGGKEYVVDVEASIK